MADDRVWKLLRHSEDPSVRTHIVHRLNPYGVPVKVVVDRLLKGSPEVSERRALILSLGEYPLESPLPEERQKELQPLLSYLADEYLSNPDAGVHSSVEWLLRRWKPKSEIRLLQEKLHGKPAGTSAWDVNKQGPTWEVNKQGQTFVIIPKVHKFMMGSPEPEFFEETGQLKGIPRCYAIGAKEVTVAQFKKFLKPGDQSQHHDKWQHRDEKEIERFLKKYSPDDDGPMIQVDWFWAAAYCNWLGESRKKYRRRSGAIRTSSKRARRWRWTRAFWAQRLSSAHRGGMGIRLPGRRDDESLLWAIAQAAGELRLVIQDNGVITDPSRGAHQAERFRYFRRVRQRLGVVPGRVHRLPAFGRRH